MHPDFGPDLFFGPAFTLVIEIIGINEPRIDPSARLVQPTRKLAVEGTLIRRDGVKAEHEVGQGINDLLVPCRLRPQDLIGG